MANIPDSAVGFLIGNLKELILYNFDLIGGVKDNVEELCRNLEMLKAFLKDYTEKHKNDNELLESFISEIRTVVYQAEDAIETYIVLASLRKRRSSLSRAIHVLDDASELRRVEKQIQKVTMYSHEINKKLLPIGIARMELREISSTGRKYKMSPMVEEDNVIGLEDATKEAIELLTGGSEQLEVISIIGMLGLGKTTLAKKILHHPHIEYEFYVRAFIHVSQEYNRKEVFLRILSAFTCITEEMRNMSDEQLVRAIRAQLEGLKYFIVLDDVWTKGAWDDLKAAFPNNYRQSRVLITSQNKAVAVHANEMIGPFYLRFLSPEESRELLRMRVFGENRCPPELEYYELRILQRCGGLPLAIVVLSGLLRNDRYKIEWWERISEGVTDFIGSDMSQVFDLIKMSYTHLPYQLKSCFLYMGIFGEDFEIPVWKLLRLWIAEGFVEQDTTISLEDIAEGYLNELVDKNLVMVGGKRRDGQIKTCRIHDILRDFCRTEALKENFFGEIKSFNQVDFPSGNKSLDNYRRLCINDSVLNYMGSKPSGMHARSFLCFAKNEITLPPEYVSSIPKAFKLLKVLDIKSIVLSRFPMDLIHLILLKYIAISFHFGMLPEKVSYLQNLQTLIIETSSLTLDIKADVCKMPQLRHLHTNASTYLQKFGNNHLFNAKLQTLSMISPESCRKGVLERTPKLKKLGICGNLANLFDASGQSSLFLSLLSKLEELENLKLLNNDISFRLQALPAPNMFPRKLRKLTLLNTSLDWKNMSTLGKLERLEVLILKDNAFKGRIWQTEDRGFCNLRVLYIGNTDLMVWEASASHFPALRSLLIRYCTKLEAVPPGFGDISTLQEIDLYYPSSGLASSARKIQLLKLKVQAEQSSTKSFGFKLLVYPPDQ